MPGGADYGVCRRVSSVVNNLFKRLLLRNYWTEFHDTLSEASLSNWEQTIQNGILNLEFFWLPWQLKENLKKLNIITTNGQNLSLIGHKGN